jgi:hypothetical protein
MGLSSFRFCCYPLLIAGVSACHGSDKDQAASADSTVSATNAHDYASDRSFLQKYTRVVELQASQSGARVLIAPQYEGRVMTSTCGGDTGYSFGWVNYNLISSGKHNDHINAYGGEERIWLAPEGGQFSFFFKKNVPFDFDHWFTPAVFDTVAFDVTGRTDSSVSFKKDFALTNRSGTSFDMQIDRDIRLLDRSAVERALGLALDSGIRAVAYESENTLVNTGKASWERKTGAPAIWLLGMMKPSPQTVIVLPVRRDQGDTTAPVHDRYFGEIPPDRWKLVDGHAYLRADGKFRGKVGVPPGHTMKYIGSYDAANHVLTVLEAFWPTGATDFVNSAWEEQTLPFSGDAFNAYNDGPLKDGSQMGPFYEVESLSPAAFLAPGKKLTHLQVTCHLQGDETSLDKISRQVLGVPLADIKNAFPG